MAAEQGAQGKAAGRQAKGRIGRATQGSVISLHAGNGKQDQWLEGKVAIKIKTLKLLIPFEPLPVTHPMKQRQVWTAAKCKGVVRRHDNGEVRKQLNYPNGGFVKRITTHL